MSFVRYSRRRTSGRIYFIFLCKCNCKGSLNLLLPPIQVPPTDTIILVPATLLFPISKSISIRIETRFLLDKSDSGLLLLLDFGFRSDGARFLLKKISTNSVHFVVLERDRICKFWMIAILEKQASVEHFGRKLGGSGFLRIDQLGDISLRHSKQ